MGRTYRRVTLSRIQKWLIATGTSAAAITGIFLFLIAMGDITVTGNSGDMMCRGDIFSPCDAYLNFTLNKDYIYLYPNESWSLFSTDKTLEKVDFYVRDLRYKTGWRLIDLTQPSEYCQRTGCKYAFRFYKSKGEWQIKIVAHKKNPFEDVKWTFGPIDPIWLADDADKYLKPIDTHVDLAYAYTEYEVCNPFALEYKDGINLTYGGNTSYFSNINVVKKVITPKNISRPYFTNRSMSGVTIKQINKTGVYIPVDENGTDISQRTRYRYCNVKDQECCDQNVWGDKCMDAHDLVWNDEIKEMEEVTTEEVSWIPWDGKISPQLSALEAKCEIIRIQGSITPMIGKKSFDHVPEVFGYKYEKYTWWDENWLKMKYLEINTSTAVDYLPVGLNITFDSDMAADMHDLRFTSSTGVPLHAINETPVLGDDAKWMLVWLNISSYATNNTFIMYYDNVNAGFNWSGSDVFEIYSTFDDIPAGTLDGKDGWSSTAQYVVTASQQKYGNASVNQNNLGGGGNMATHAISPLIQTSRTIVYVMATVKDTHSDSGFDITPVEAAQGPITDIRYHTESNVFKYRNSGWSTHPAAGLNVWYRVDVKVYAADLYNYTNNFTTIDGAADNLNNINIGIDGLRLTDQDIKGSEIFVDQIMVGKAVKEDPIYFFGAEQAPIGADNITVTIDFPQNETNNDTEVDFGYIPTVIMGNSSNCSLYTNYTAWSSKEGNKTLVTDNVTNIITENFLLGSYEYAVACWSATAEYYSSKYTINIIDTVDPRWYTNSTNSTYAGQNISHNLNWTDVGGGEMSGHIFSFCNGTWNGSWCIGASPGDPIESQWTDAADWNAGTSVNMTHNNTDLLLDSTWIVPSFYTNVTEGYTYANVLSGERHAESAGSDSYVGGKFIYGSGADDISKFNNTNRSRSDTNVDAMNDGTNLGSNDQLNGLEIMNNGTDNLLFFGYSIQAGSGSFVKAYYADTLDYAYEQAIYQPSGSWGTEGCTNNCTNETGIGVLTDYCWWFCSNYDTDARYPRVYNNTWDIEATYYTGKWSTGGGMTYIGDFLYMPRGKTKDSDSAWVILWYNGTGFEYRYTIEAGENYKMDDFGKDPDEESWWASSYPSTDDIVEFNVTKEAIPNHEMSGSFTSAAQESTYNVTYYNLTWNTSSFADNFQTAHDPLFTHTVCFQAAENSTGTWNWTDRDCSSPIDLEALGFADNKHFQWRAWINTTINYTTPYINNVNLSYSGPQVQGNGGWINDTWKPLSGYSAWANVTKMVNTTITANISWCSYANDTSDNWNASSCDDPWYYELTEAPDEQPPQITILQPWNITYTNNTINFNVTGSEILSWVVVQIGNTNSSNFTNATGTWNYLNDTLADGQYEVQFWFNDTAGLMNTTNITFTIDTTAPSITIFNPLAITYNNNTILFNVTMDEVGGECVVDYGGSNKSMTNSTGTWNHQDTTLVDGTYITDYWCNDSVNNMGFATVTFILDVIQANVTGDVEYGTAIGVSYTGTACLTNFYNTLCGLNPEVEYLAYPALYTFQEGSTRTIAANETVAFTYNNKSILVFDAMVNVSPETTPIKDLTIDVLNNHRWDSQFLGSLYAKGRIIHNETNESTHPFNITDGFGVFYVRLSPQADFVIANVTIGNNTPSITVNIDTPTTWDYNGELLDASYCVDGNFDTYTRNIGQQVTKIYENYSIPNTVVDDSISWSGKFEGQILYGASGLKPNISVYWYNWTASEWDLANNCYEPVYQGTACTAFYWHNESLPSADYISSDDVFSQQVQLSGSAYASTNTFYYESKINYSISAPVDVEIDTINDGTNETYIAELNSMNSYALNISGIDKYLSSKNASFVDIPISISYSPTQVNLSVFNVTINYTIFNTSLNITAIRDTTPINTTIAVRFNWSGNNLVVDDLLSPYRGNGNTTIFAFTEGSFSRASNDSVPVYYSNFTVGFPFGTLFADFLPPTNNSKNITPWGQISSIPLMNITAKGYNKPMNFTIFVNESYDTCMNITASSANTKHGGTNWIVDTTLRTMFSDMSENESAGIWFWGDFNNCSANRWYEWYPNILSVCTTCSGGW